MVVAKRQGKEKPGETEQRKVRGPEWGPGVGQTALLASSVYIGQAQGRRETRKEEPQGWGPLSLFSLCLLGWHALTPWGCISPHFLNKTELYGAVTRICQRVVTLICHGEWWHGLSEGFNTGLLLLIFVVMRQNWGNYRLPWCRYAAGAH